MQNHKKEEKWEKALFRKDNKDTMIVRQVIKMTLEKIISTLENNKILDKDTLYKLIRDFHPNYKDTSIRWVIYDMTKKGYISKLNATQYIVGKVNVFRQQNASPERNEIIALIDKELPNIRIVVYESTLLNEWANHQIARNVFFVEVEKYFVKDVFRLLYNKFPIKVILNPDRKDLYLYEGELIIVKQLISQAPINQETREIKIEKLIVDLYAKDLITEFINEDEIDDVINDIFKTYYVNMKTIYAYSKRRNNLDIIKKTLSGYELGK